MGLFRAAVEMLCVFEASLLGRDADSLCLNFEKTFKDVKMFFPLDIKEAKEILASAF